MALIRGAFGLGAELGVLLPFSRAHEAQADIIGRMFMAEAGYPPGEATRVWDGMEATSPWRTPVFLSTHPSDEQRRANLEEWEPRARKKCRRNALERDTRETLWRAERPRKEVSLAE